MNTTQSRQHYWLFLAFTLALMLVILFQRSSSSATATPLIDMLTLASTPGLCLTVEGVEVTSTPSLVLKTCRNTHNQRWLRQPGTSQWRTLLDYNYCLATVDDTLHPGGRITVRPCTDKRALTLFAAQSQVTIRGTLYELAAVTGRAVTLARLRDAKEQQWRWFQEVP